jgi:predicted DCC family thiol-disulfide oxidoreductase YuxK
MDAGISIFVDSWCPHCKRFGEWVKRRDTKNVIAVKDARESLDQRIDAKKALTQMASMDARGNVFYGFQSIVLIMKNLPVFQVVSPIFSLPLVSTLGSILYNELAVRRKIIPLHCEERDCYQSK